MEFDAPTSDSVGKRYLQSGALTPGTVTLDVHDGRVRVRCLTKQGADALLGGEFNRRVTELMKD